MPENSLTILREIAQIPGLLIQDKTRWTKAKEIYGDLAKPGVSQVGKALGTLVGLGNTILWPLALLNERTRISLERNLEKYRSRLEEVNEDKIVEVRPELGVPILEKLGYVSDEELSDLYINLLARASIAETAHFAHPAFIAIINNLTPDEALLLKAIGPAKDIPFLTAQLVDKTTGAFGVAGDILTGLERRTKLSFSGNVDAYFSNFEGLGLIEIRRDIRFSAPAAYEELERQYSPDDIDNLRFGYKPDTHEWRLQKGKIDITSFGRLFIRACLKNVKDPDTHLA